MSDTESSAETPRTRPHGASGGDTFRRIATIPLPLWLVTLLFVAIVVGFSFLYLQKSTVDLGNAIPDAQAVELTVTLCNEVVDEREINPRQAELDLEGLFEDQLGVQSATVTVDRLDCDAATTTTPPATSTTEPPTSPTEEGN